MKTTVEKGKIGEIYASKYLVKNNYKILATNFRTRYGEIDIIASKKDLLVFVEVKLKTNLNYGYGREEVTTDKQRKIKNVASYFMQKHNLLDCKCQFDVIEIQNDTVTHIENAF